MFQRLPVYTGDGNPQNGLYLAEQAAARAADGSSHVVAGWSAAFAAEAHALVGEEAQSQAAPGAGRLPPYRRQTDDPMFGVFGKGTARPCRCLPASLERPRAPRQRFRTPRGAWVGREKHQSVILADLSTAFVLQDDPEHACTVLHRVIDLVELTGSAAAGKRRAFAAGRGSPAGATGHSSRRADRLLARRDPHPGSC